VKHKNPRQFSFFGSPSSSMSVCACFLRVFSLCEFVEPCDINYRNLPRSPLFIVVGTFNLFVWKSFPFLRLLISSPVAALAFNCMCLPPLPLLLSWTDGFISFFLLLGPDDIQLRSSTRSKRDIRRRLSAQQHMNIYRDACEYFGKLVTCANKALGILLFLLLPLATRPCPCFFRFFGVDIFFL